MASEAGGCSAAEHKSHSADGRVGRSTEGAAGRPPPRRSGHSAARWLGRTSGSVPVEFALSAGVLVLPIAMLVLVFPTWAERQSAARLAAQEAARAVVLADDCEDGYRSAALLVAEIAANHELTDGLDLDPPAGCTGDLARGQIVTATVTVQIPLTAIPLMGTAGGFEWTVSHSEKVDQYRSLP